MGLALLLKRHETEQESRGIECLVWHHFGLCVDGPVVADLRRPVKQRELQQVGGSVDSMGRCGTALLDPVWP